MTSIEVTSQYYVGKQIVGQQNDTINSYFEPELNKTMIILLTCCCLISAVAIIGNALILWIIIRSKRMRTVNNYYIANVAFADLLVGSLTIPFQYQSILMKRWVLPYFMCML